MTLFINAPGSISRFLAKSSTMEPSNKGHVETRSFVLYREVSFIRRLKCTGIIGIGTSRFVLYREVFFIRSVLYQRFHCTYKAYSGPIIIYIGEVKLFFSLASHTPL